MNMDRIDPELERELPYTCEQAVPQSWFSNGNKSEHTGFEPALGRRAAPRVVYLLMRRPDAITVSELPLRTSSVFCSSGMRTTSSQN
jgi:hypothetical protein